MQGFNFPSADLSLCCVTIQSLSSRANFLNVWDAFRSPFSSSSSSSSVWVSCHFKVTFKACCFYKWLTANWRACTHPHSADPVQMGFEWYTRIWWKCPGITSYLATSSMIMRNRGREGGSDHDDDQMDALISNSDSSVASAVGWQTF